VRFKSASTAGKENIYVQLDLCCSKSAEAEGKAEVEIKEEGKAHLQKHLDSVRWIAVFRKKGEMTPEVRDAKCLANAAGPGHN
jgi:hypothetical protein